MRGSWLYCNARNDAGSTGLNLASVVGCNSQASDGDVLGAHRNGEKPCNGTRGCASSIASEVSVSEPIWFTFTSRALAAPSSILQTQTLGLV